MNDEAVPHPPGGMREWMAALRSRGFHASARRGQSFLFDPQLLDALIDDAGVRDNESILEIGPGAGTLSRRLLARGCRLLAFEIDGLLCDFLREHLRVDRFHLFEGDALRGKNQLSPALVAALRDLGAPYRLVSNLPFAIATPLLQLLVTGEVPPQSAGVLVQREAAERWVATPGSSEYGPSSVVLQLLGTGRIRRYVDRRLFVPPPRVDAAFFTWHPNGTPFPDRDRTVALVRHLFQQRRKMLRVLLRDTLPADDPWWAAAGVDPTLRPSALPPAVFPVLAGELHRRGGLGAPQVPGS